MPSVNIQSLIHFTNSQQLLLGKHGTRDQNIQRKIAKNAQKQQSLTESAEQQGQDLSPAGRVNSTLDEKESQLQEFYKPETAELADPFYDLLAVNGPAPETVNGRMAMLGFVALVAVELVTGRGVLEQLSGDTLPILAVAATITAASFVPLLKGTRVKGFGSFNIRNEIIIGRAAMFGFTFLIAFEYLTGSNMFAHVF